MSAGSGASIAAVAGSGEIVHNSRPSSKSGAQAMSSGDDRAQPASPPIAPASDPLREALAAEFKLARQHCAAGEFVAAERLCRRMLKSAPGHPQVTLMLGEVLSSQERQVIKKCRVVDVAVALLVSAVILRPWRLDYQASTWCDQPYDLRH